ncbi:MAG: hypothetical protein ACOY9Y_09770 [Bacillota bacterium]
MMPREEAPNYRMPTAEEMKRIQEYDSKEKLPAEELEKRYEKNEDDSPVIR